MTESKYLKREFGEALPTFKGVMKQHQINKLEEGWWDDMSDAAKKAYIKKHGEAPSVAGDDEDDYDMGEVPGSRGTGPWTPEDDPDFEHGPSLTSAPGRVPDEDEPSHPDDMDDRDVFQFLNKDEPEDEGEPYKREPFQPGDDPEELSVGAAQEELEKAKAEMADAEERGDKAAYADAEEKADALEGRLGVTDEPDEIDLGKPYPDGNAPPKTSMVDRFSSQEHLDNSLEQQKQYQSHLNKWAEEAADNDDDETLAKIQELDDENKKEIERLEKDGAKGMYRTGNELNQETLTIDGKQYRRISEGVEKQPKPKYEFSEFYERFKK